MISERQLALGFSGFWQDLLPLLTPRFVRVFNEGYVHELEDINSIKLEPIPVGIDNQNHAVVAEMAFFLAKLAHDNSMTVAEAAEVAEICERAATMASGTCKEYEDGTPSGEIKIRISEFNEAVTLAKRYDNLYSHFDGDTQIEFSPFVAGAGFMHACHADLSINSTLFEIKTVNRNLAGKDLRQLIIYLALQAATGNRRWTSAGFFNPRRGTIAEFKVDTLLIRLSGGRTPFDIFDELVAFASTRDALFDTIF